jgi:ABC-type branched-subunit amino acid transport system substrate-binding protein
MHALNSILMAAQKFSTVVLVGVTLIVSACHESPRVVKIGLVAPFEGRYRSVGYDVIPAVRLAIREFAKTGGAKVAVELVAYDDSGEPDRAVIQAEKVVADPQVHAVIGHWRDDTTLAALGIYDEAGITVITYTPMDTSGYAHVVNMAPSIQALETAAARWSAQLKLDQSAIREISGDIVKEAARFDSAKAGGDSINLLGGPDWGLLQFDALTSGNLNGVYFVTGAAFPEDTMDDLWSKDWVGNFSAGFEDGAAGAPPGHYSAAAYEATWLALNWVTTESPDATYVTTLNVDLDKSKRRSDAPVYLYQWQDDKRVFVDVFP